MLPRPVQEALYDQESGADTGSGGYGNLPGGGDGGYDPPSNLAPDRAAFVQQYAPYAHKYSQETGIAPETYLAMGGSESNFGKAGSIFGIKGPSPSGKSTNYATHEVINGKNVNINDDFATYDSPDEAFQHFNSLLQTPRYKAAGDYVKQTGDQAGFLRMLNDAGYATDPHWADSIVSIAQNLGAVPQGTGDVPYPAGQKQPPPGYGTSFATQALNSDPSTFDAGRKARIEQIIGNLNTGDVPYAAGQDQASGPTPAERHAKAMELINGLGNGPLGDVGGALKGAADYGIGPLETAKDYASQAFRQGGNVIGDVILPGRMVGPGGPGGPAPQRHGDNLIGGIAEEAVGGQIPTTPAGVVTTVGPGELLKGAKFLAGIKGVEEGAQAIKGAENVLSIVPKNAKQLKNVMEDSLRVAKEASDAVLSRGGSAVEARQAAKEAMQQLTHATAQADDVTRAVDSAVESQKYTNTGKRLKATAQELSQASDALKTPPGAAGIVEQTARAAPEGAQELATATNRELIGKDFPETPAEIEKVLNAEAARIASTATPSPQAEWWVNALKVARDVADPVTTLRHMWNASGSDTVNAATNGKRGDTFTDAAKAEQAARAAEERAAVETAGSRAQAAVKEAPLADQGIRDAAAKFRDAEAANAAREADQAALAARNGEMLQKGGGIEAVVQRSRERAAAAADAAEATRIASEAAQGDAGLRAAAQEARTGSEAIAKRETHLQQQAAQRAIEEHQAAVEAADLARNKAKWEAGMAANASQAEKDAALETAKGYHKGGFGNDVAALLGLPRALSLSTDVGTVRDLGLLVGTKDGRQAVARGGKAGLASIIHSDEDARAVVEGAEQGSRWFGMASDGKVLDRPFHEYKFGAGVDAADRVPEMSSLNSSRISQVVEKYHPGIKFSDRALAVQRNVAGIDLLESRLNEIAVKYGVATYDDALKNPRFLSEMQSTVDSVNHLRGFSGGGKAKGLSVLNALTSPQQMISRLQVIGDPLNFAARGDMESAKFAAKSLAGFATSQAALLTMANLTSGAGRWSVQLNPTAGDFGTIRVGNTRYDTMAGLGPTLRLVNRIGAEVSDQAFDTDYAKNQAAVGTLVQRWLENKEQPVSRIVTDFMFHNKLPNEQTAINMLAPSIATGFMQSLKEESEKNKALAVPTAGLNFIGIGTNTYSTSKDKADQIAQDLTGHKFDELSRTERLPVLAQLPDDATKGPGNPKQAAREDYEARRKQAGYADAPKDRFETADETAARNKANARVFKNDPTLDVERWFYESNPQTRGDQKQAASGSLSSPEAVNKALELNLPDREVKFQHFDRVINKDEGSKKAWQQEGERVQRFFDDGYLATKYGADDIKAMAASTRQDAKDYAGKKWADLDEAHQAKVLDYIRGELRKDSPKTDAALAYFGYGGANKRYTIHSKDALAELKRLRDSYGRDAAKPGYEFYGDY